MVKRTKRIALAAMFAAIAVTLSFFSKMAGIPIVSLPFLQLQFDCKDFIIAISGFVLNPLYAICISFIVALIEMLTFSDTQLWGMIMNFISSAVFAGVASAIYYKERTIKGAVIGLISSTVLTTATMLCWNYLIVPLYSSISRSDVASMLIPVFMPYNLIKYGINAAITLFVYKPLALALQKIGLITKKSEKKFSVNIWVYTLAALVICISIIAVILIRN